MLLVNTLDGFKGTFMLISCELFFNKLARLLPFKKGHMSFYK